MACPNSMASDAAGAPEVDAFDRAVLTAGLQSGHEGTAKLAAQLAGVPACDGCGYIKTACRCASGVKEVGHG